MANEINQIKVGSTTYTLQDERVDDLVTGVSSVNSKTGAVSLEASDVGALSLDGGTINKSKTVKMDASANSNGANLKWGTVNSKNPYIGYASDQTDGTFILGSLAGTNYASGLAIGGGSGNLLWKGTKVATTSDIPSVPTVNNATLTIQKNGTNVATFTANASSNATANITVPTKASDVSALPISGGTIAGTSGDTPLYIKSAHATASYEGFQRTDGTTLGYFGYSSKDTPAVYLSSGAKTIYHTGNLPTIPTVYNGILTITENGTSKGTFSANQSGNTTIALTNTTYSNATTSAAGLMSAADKKIVNRFTYDDNTPQLVINGGASAIDMNDDAIHIDAAGGLYYGENEVAVKSDIPTATSQLTNNSGYITGVPTKIAGTTGGYLHCGNDGVTETGRYLDMHFAEADSLDFSTRLQCGGNHGNTVVLPSESGTLALTSELWNLSDRIYAGTSGTKSVYVGALTESTDMGNYAFSTGSNKKASGSYSTAHGTGNTASGSYSVACGFSNTASSSCAVALGGQNTASGYYSTAFGNYNTANAYYSTVMGYYNTAQRNQLVIGRYATTSYVGPTSNTATSGSLFIIGKGTGTSARSNAFRVMTTGAVYGAAAYNSSGADYAEMWEWADGNPNNEDRRGKLVTVDENNKIRIATDDDEYILGIISATPCVVGDVESENWHEMYLKDVFGQHIVKTVEVPEHTDEETGEVIPAHTAQEWVLNPEYDPTKPYVSRDERKEWAAVGLMGKLVVIDDGTCVAGQYCKLTGDGTVTASTDKNDWRVLKRMDSTHVQILYR